MEAFKTANITSDNCICLIACYISLQPEHREEQKHAKPNLTALRLQALSGLDNGGDSAAPSVTDPGDQEDPASVLDAIGEIASDRVAANKAEVPPLRTTVDSGGRLRCCHCVA